MEIAFGIELCLSSLLEVCLGKGQRQNNLNDLGRSVHQNIANENMLWQPVMMIALHCNCKAESAFEKLLRLA